MSQRNSGYGRKDRDCYETPEWVTEALLPHLRDDLIIIWEPACGSRKMSRVLERKTNVCSSDIADGGYDFLACTKVHGLCNAIITNPPYSLAEQFICHALKLMHPVKGMCAFLLRTDFDHAKTRAHLFGCEQFAKKIALVRRIVWFERKGAAPSFNHAWFIWDWQHRGPPTLAYAGL